MRLAGPRKEPLIGSNEFFIVGPAGDPARIKEANSAIDAYKRIAGAQAKFFSRGDNSGTHKKEMGIWQEAGLKPAGDWYVVTKDFMTATLKRANDEKGYFMVDSSTWVAEKKNLPNLVVLFKGDKALVNTYHALVQPAGATPGAAIGARFIDFVAGAPRDRRSSRITAGISTARGCTTTPSTPNNTIINRDQAR